MTCQLYLLTPPRIEAGFTDTLISALDAGEVAALQIRLKDHSLDEIKQLAPPLVRAAQARGVAVILNDDPELAVALGCDGVHVGQGDVKAIPIGHGGWPCQWRTSRLLASAARRQR